MTGLRLNLGCGGQVVDGWVNVDRPLVVRGDTFVERDGSGRQLGPPVVLPDTVVERPGVVPLDLRDAWPWPWEDGSVEGIVMHHVADLLTADELHDVLVKCRRVLQRGGVLRVSCADLTRGIERAMAGDWSWCAEPIVGTLPAVVCNDAFLAGGDQIDEAATLGHFVLQGGARKQFLTPTRFATMADRAGFKWGRFAAYREALRFDQAWSAALDSRPDESWFYEAHLR